jgi:ABC-2 type transport system permease protein
MKLIDTSKFSYTQQKNLLFEMIRTDFKLRYQESVLGYVWSLLKPLFLFIILFVVFTQFLNIGKRVPNYHLSLLLGLVLWNFFTEATSGALKSVVGKGGLIRKIDIPRYLIPIASVASAFINMLVSLGLVFAFVLFAKNTAVSWSTIILFPLLLLEFALIAVAVGYFLAALYVRFRDISHIWDVIKQALWYGIPLIYPITVIPSVFIQKLLILNPLAQTIQDMRAVVTYSGTPTVSSLFHNPLMHALPIVAVVLALIFAVWFFNKKSDGFAELV